MASDAQNPVKVSKAATTYPRSTQDPELRSQINTVLLQDGHVAKIQETLLHALHASPSNWPTLIQNHALALLRSGEYTTFPALMARVLEDVKRDIVAERDEPSKDATTNGTATNGAAVGKQSLALPRPVVEEGVKITRECLESVCVIEE